MARKLRPLKGRATYAQRKWIVEPVFGFIKRGLGFTQFLLNGIDGGPPSPRMSVRPPRPTDGQM